MVNKLLLGGWGVLPSALSHFQLFIMGPSLRVLRID